MCFCFFKIMIWIITYGSQHIWEQTCYDCEVYLQRSSEGYFHLKALYLNLNLIYLLIYFRWQLLFFSDSFGSIKAAELDWGNENHIQAVDPPFDYIIGTDVVSFLIIFHRALLGIVVSSNCHAFIILSLNWH